MSKALTSVEKEGDLETFDKYQLMNIIQWLCTPLPKTKYQLMKILMMAFTKEK